MAEAITKKLNNIQIKDKRLLFNNQIDNLSVYRYDSPSGQLQKIAIKKKSTQEIIIHVPYVSEKLEWTILYDIDSDSLLAPDFIFDDDFMDDPNETTINEHIKSWNEWCLDDEEALSRIIYDWWNLYKKHQVELLEKRSDYHKMYKNFLKELKIDENDIDVLVRDNYVKLLINLKLDFPKLPLFSTELINSQENKIFLMMKYLKTDKSEARLYLSPRLENVVNINELNRNVSGYNLDDINNFVLCIKTEIEKQLIEASQLYEKRQKYICTLQLLYPKNFIEFDNIQFLYLALLFQQNEIMWVANVQLDKHFPKTKPIFTIKLINKLKNDSELISYEYNCEWTFQQMIESAMDAMSTYININSNKTV